MLFREPGYVSLSRLFALSLALLHRTVEKITVGDNENATVIMSIVFPLWFGNGKRGHAPLVSQVLVSLTASQIIES